MTHPTRYAAAYDLVIVGGGPIGLELAAAAMRAGLRCVLFEAGEIGHTISWWAPGTRWFSSNERIAIAGVSLESPDQTKCTREQYLAYLRGVVRSFDLPVRTYTPVQRIERRTDHLVVSVGPPDRTEQLRTAAAVLAIGGTDYPKELGILGADLPHVDGYFREPHRYWGRRLVILGGRNSAVEAALRAYQVGADVTLVYRGSQLPRQSIKYWLLPEIEGLIRSGRIAAYFNAVALRIDEQSVSIEIRSKGGELPNSESTEEKTDAAASRSGQAVEQLCLPADDVLSLIGYRQDKRLFRECGVELTDVQERPVFDPETMMTNVSGLYVAGTAVAGTQSSKYRIFVENCHEHVDRIMASLLAGHSRSAEHIKPTLSESFQEHFAAMPES